MQKNPWWIQEQNTNILNKGKTQQDWDQEMASDVS